MKRIAISFLFHHLFYTICLSQLSLDSCFYLAKQNFPQLQQIQLLNEVLDQQLRNINTQWLPGLQGTAQAGYQSDVTSINIPIPGFPSFTPPPKDQYRFFIDATQAIYDGNASKNQKKLARQNIGIESLKIETEFFKIKEKLIQIFYGILLTKEQVRILKLTQEDLKNNMKKAEVSYDAQVISAYQLNQIKSEKVKFQQKETELQYQLKTLLSNLEKIIGRPVLEKDSLDLPKLSSVNSELNRPEFKLIQLQKAVLQYQNKLNINKSIPKLFGFAQLGYSNPALNFLKDEFQAYYIAGLRLNWNISSLYQRSNDQRIYKLNSGITQLQEDAFRYKLNLEKTQFEKDLDKYKALISYDQELISLQEKVKAASQLQYDNGTLNWADLNKDINALEQARLNEVLHRIMLLQSISLQQNLNGN